VVSRREAVLDGTLEAARLHKELRTRDHIKKESARVDVFSAITSLNVVLLFKPLDGLLGAYMSSPEPGILVTTERRLAIQRYTAAHELGHFRMKHSLSLDDEQIIQRSPFENGKYSDQEVAADTFAAMFLLPDWLFEFQSEQQGWTREDLNRPGILYQLSLRLGTSYESTCRMLHRHGFTERSSVEQLLKVAPRDIKENLLGQYKPPTWHPNVWVLTERDADTVIYGEPDDVFVVRLKEHSGAGYLWNLEQVKAAGFGVIADQRIIPGVDDDVGDVGGEIERVLTAKSETATRGTLEFVEARSWDVDDNLTRVSFGYDIRGREHGLARAMRERVAAA
jgi:Zn-dependent peptidase ImmA (M78 family)